MHGHLLFLWIAWHARECLAGKAAPEVATFGKPTMLSGALTSKYTKPDQVDKEHQWVALKRYLQEAWLVAAHVTKDGKGKMCVGECSEEEAAGEDPARISYEGFLASFDPKEYDKVADKLGSRMMKYKGWKKPEWKFRDPTDPKPKGEKPLMAEKPWKNWWSRKPVTFRGKHGIVDKWTKAIFHLGLELMDARAEELDIEGKKPVEAAAQPTGWQGLDRHAFVYCWTVAYALTWTSCTWPFGCNFVPEVDEFFGPAFPKDETTMKIDELGALAKARSKLWMYMLFAQYDKPQKKNVADGVVKYRYDSGSVTAGRREAINKHSWAGFWHAVKSEKIHESRREAFHRFLLGSFDAATEMGWYTWRAFAEPAMQGVSFQYMSLLVEEFACEKKPVGFDRRVMYPDKLQLLRPLSPDEEDFPLL